VLFLLRITIQLRRAETGTFAGMLLLLGTYYLTEEATVRGLLNISQYDRTQTWIAAAFYGLEVPFVPLFLEMRRGLWLRLLPFVVAVVYLLMPAAVLGAMLQVACALLVARNWRLPQSRKLAFAFGPMALALMLGALNQTTYFHFPLSFSVLSFTLDSSSFAALWFMMTLTISLADRSTAAQRYQERLTHEMAASATVQNASLRSGLETVPGIEVRHAYRPAQEVGGDFYQVKALSTGGALVLLGDVSGKGLSAALTVSELLGAFRALSLEFSEPGTILTALNKLICARGTEGFVTACCLSFVEGEVRLTNAGHIPPISMARPGIAEQPCR
jgi:hypothetical protein